MSFPGFHYQFFCFTAIFVLIFGYKAKKKKQKKKHNNNKQNKTKKPRKLLFSILVILK